MGESLAPRTQSLKPKTDHPKKIQYNWYKPLSQVVQSWAEIQCPPTTPWWAKWWIKAFLQTREPQCNKEPNKHIETRSHESKSYHDLGNEGVTLLEKILMVRSHPICLTPILITVPWCYKQPYNRSTLHLHLITKHGTWMISEWQWVKEDLLGLIWGRVS